MTDLLGPRPGEAILRFGPGEAGFRYTLVDRTLWTDRPLLCLGPPEARGLLPPPSPSWNPPFDASAEPDRFEELALGPPILTLLAERGVWALHASAVFLGDRLFLLVGESGRGKSTLAAHAGTTVPGWRRAADDLVPFELRDGRLLAHLDYPQLKLDPPRRSVAPAPATALIVLAGPGSAVHPELTALRPSETAQLLCAQTVAARRFPPDLLAAHFDACAELAKVVPAYRLALPRDLARLGEAAAQIDTIRS